MCACNIFIYCIMCATSKMCPCRVVLIRNNVSVCASCAIAGPRRMSERDLSSRLGRETIPQQIHSSKSVPALHSK